MHHLDSVDYLAEQSAIDADQAAYRARQPDLQIRMLMGDDGARIIRAYVEAEVERLVAAHPAIRAATVILDAYQEAKG